MSTQTTTTKTDLIIYASPDKFKNVQITGTIIPINLINPTKYKGNFGRIVETVNLNDHSTMDSLVLSGREIVFFVDKSAKPTRNPLTRLYTHLFITSVNVEYHEASVFRPKPGDKLHTWY